MSEKTKQALLIVVAVAAVAVAIAVGMKSIGPASAKEEIVGELVPGSTTSLRDSERASAPGSTQAPPPANEADASGMPAELR